MQHLSRHLSKGLIHHEDSPTSLPYIWGRPSSRGRRWGQLRISSEASHTLLSLNVGLEAIYKILSLQHSMLQNMGWDVPSHLTSQWSQSDQHLQLLKLTNSLVSISNITVPLEALPKAGQETAKSLLPVMVFVHGYVVYHFYLFYRIHYLMFIKRSFHE